jgi:short-subunit dehydrogenase
MNLKNVSEQVILITGATSGIGLTTARLAADKGAKLVLVARNEQALKELADEINSKGGEAIFVAADVADEGDLQGAADLAVQRFGRIDTWVNNAGGSIYGRIMDVPTEDLRKLFETNLWGVVNGSRIAVKHLRNHGGAIINLGSEVSDAAVPLQGIYSASKHAVKGFTDSLRMELEADGLPISVTIIKPTATHTPFTENARNYLPYEPQLPQPLYAPDLVAEAILFCAENPTREFMVGEMSKVHSSMAHYTPRLAEKFNEAVIDSYQNSGKPARPNRHDGLYETNSNLHERGSADRFVMEQSLYQQTQKHPYLTAGLLLGGGMAVAAWLGARRSAMQEDRNIAAGPIRARPQGRHAGISEHMEVVGSDRRHVGVVDRVDRDKIILTRLDPAAGGRHHIIPRGDIASVENDRIVLNQTADQARRDWHVAGSKPLDRRMAGGRNH